MIISHLEAGVMEELSVIVKSVAYSGQQISHDGSVHASAHDAAHAGFGESCSASGKSHDAFGGNEAHQCHAAYDFLLVDKGKMV